MCTKLTGRDGAFTPDPKCHFTDEHQHVRVASVLFHWYELGQLLAGAVGQILWFTAQQGIDEGEEHSGYPEGQMPIGEGRGEDLTESHGYQQQKGGLKQTTLLNLTFSLRNFTGDASRNLG